MHTVRLLERLERIHQQLARRDLPVATRMLEDLIDEIEAELADRMAEPSAKKGA